MSISAAEWEREERRLEQVLGVIDRQLEAREALAEKHRKDIRATHRSVWGGAAFDRGDDEDARWDWAQHIERLQGQQRQLVFSDRAVRRLKRLSNSPYFARIDFANRATEAPEALYIGLHSLVDEHTGRFLVYDWRAPVAGMFYDFEPGPAWYESPAGKVSGRLLNKRQYKIRNRKLQYMFDSSLQIADDALQEILAQATDARLQHIVESIQREQNQVIRDDSHRLIVVQGAAGSGKTSIALHRIAYLLYKYHKSLSADNMLIFSPNRLFSDYIADVLPELGEQNALQTTFQETAEHLLDRALVPESFNQQLEYLLTRVDDAEYETRTRLMTYKASKGFAQLFHNYVDYLEKGTGLEFCDVAWQGKLLMSADEMRELFNETYSYLPWHARVEKIARRVLFLLKPIQDRRRKELRKQLLDDSELVHLNKRELRQLTVQRTWEEFQPVVGRLQEWATFDLVECYRRLFVDDVLFAQVSRGIELPVDIAEIRQATARRLESDMVPYEDVAPFLLLDGYSCGFETQPGLRHVVVDEAQDYSRLQYELLRQLFPNARFTLLGDLNQSIHPHHSIDRYEDVLQVMGETQGVLVQLAHTYRSTRELVEFCSALLPDEPPVAHVGRPGDKPVVVEAAEPDDLSRAVAGAVGQVAARGAKSIAIICRTSAECVRAHDQLAGTVDAKLLTTEERRYRGGTVVIPAYLAKGLEFDAVVVYNAGGGAYGREGERRLFYTVCTRARHHLWICHAGELTYFVRDMDPQFFETVVATTPGLCGPSRRVQCSDGTPSLSMKNTLRT